MIVSPKPPSSVAIFEPAETKEVLAALTSTFRASLRPTEAFGLSAVIAEGHVEVTLVLARADQSEVVALVAASKMADGKAESLAVARARSIDFLGGWLEDYFAGERIPGPHHDWREYDIDGQTVLFRGEWSNAALEAQADAILAAAERDA